MHSKQHLLHIFIDVRQDVAREREVCKTRWKNLFSRGMSMPWRPNGANKDKEIWQSNVQNAREDRQQIETGDKIDTLTNFSNCNRFELIGQPFADNMTATELSCLQFEDRTAVLAYS